MSGRLARFAQGYALPGPELKRLLRIALGIGEDAHSPESLRWALARIGDSERGLRWLMPLLAATNGKAEGLSPDIQAKLQAARLYEKQRSQRFDEIAASAIAKIGETSAPPLISRGLALARTAYPCREARHCHDLDLLVREMTGARAAMQQTGFAAIPEEAGLRHASGMTARLHLSPFPGDGGHPLDSAIWERAAPFELAGAPVLLAAPTDVLLHTILLPSWLVAGHATWIVDAHFALAADSIEWEALDRLPAPDRLFAARALSLLAEEFSAPVPAELLARPVKLPFGEVLESLKRMARWKGRKALLREGLAALMG